MKTDLMIPITVFEKNEVGAIRELLGNDVTINGYVKNDVIINDYLIITVDYDMIDIDPFNVYKITDCKHLNMNSDKYITEINGKLVKLNDINTNDKDFWIRIFSAKQSTEDNIKYYGFKIEKQSDLLHSFCSIFGGKILSYHGTEVKSELETNKKLSTLLKMKLKKIDNKEETKQYNKLHTVENEYINSFHDISYFKPQDDNDLQVTTLDTIDKDGAYIIDIQDYTAEKLKQDLIKQEKGIILLINDRINPLSMIFIKNNDYTIHPHVVDCFITTVLKDIEILNKVYGK